VFSKPVVESMAVRNVFSSAHSLVLYLVTGLLLLRRRDRRTGWIELIPVSFLLAMAFINALRIVIIYFLGYPGEELTRPAWDAIATILYSVVFMGLGIALFTLHSARLAAELREALASKQLLMREMSHRLKNNLALVDSLLAMVPDFSAKKESSEEWVGEVRERIRCIAEAHDLLNAREDPDAISLDAYLARITRGLAVPKSVAIETNFRELEVPSSLAIPLGLVANELATNSLKYAFVGRESGRISMSLSGEPGRGVLVVSDDGIGTSWPPAREGFGTIITMALVQQIGAELQFVAGAGSTFRISFPLEAKAKA
jgi:two-component sensor histidine kinase